MSLLIGFLGALLILNKMNELNIKHLSFTKRPIPIPAEYRPSYKIAQICFMLKYSCVSSKSSLLKLHLLSWALKSPKNRNTVLELIHNNYESAFSTWGIDPAVNRALHIAVAESYCSYLKGKYKLTSKGLIFIETIEQDRSILTEEISFLKQVGKKTLTENRLSSLSKKWLKFND